MRPRIFHAALAVWSLLCVLIGVAGTLRYADFRREGYIDAIVQGIERQQVRRGEDLYARGRKDERAEYRRAIDQALEWERAHPNDPSNHSVACTIDRIERDRRNGSEKNDGR